MKVATGQRQITAGTNAFVHEEDRRALDALKKIPFFDKICSKLISVFRERSMNVYDMSSKVLITEQQLPRIYGMVKEICEDLHIEMPKLYLELDRMPNACTYGDEKPTISITSGLLECLSDEEIYAVLAHECGHIACQHVLYHTMGNLLLSGGELLLNHLLGGLITLAAVMPIKLAFFRWMRCSELSADRAAAVCVRGAKPVIGTMMRLAGGTASINEELDEELFLSQAKEYREIANTNMWNKFLESCMIMDAEHPLLAVRAYEIKTWCEQEEFEHLIAALPKREKKAEKAKKKKKWFQFWIKD